MQHTDYRRDIDGLRAVAVLSVLIFHFYPRALPGGFIGVDVFFVISGYLITSVILRETAENQFTFKEFYRRRIRRILPAFYLITLASLLVAPIFLFPEALVELAQSAIGASLFVSNHYFADRFDYFSPGVWELPLAHTWSLSVEEQFYLMWPLLILGFKRTKLSSKAVKVWMLAATLASVALGEYFLAQPGLAKSAYYLLATRSCGLFGGGLLAFQMFDDQGGKANTRAPVVYLGIALLVAGFFIAKGEADYPGFRSLFPCLGTVLIIWGGVGSRTYATRFLSSRAMVGVGLLSYSLYLWHWPILALGRYFLGSDKLSAIQALVLATLVALLSFLSWKYVEQNLRKVQWSFTSTALCLFVAPLALVLLLAGLMLQSKGWPARFSNSQERMEQDTKFLAESFCFQRVNDSCVIGAPGKKAHILLFGDSNAGHYMPYWDELGMQTGSAIFAAGVDRCYPLLDVEGHHPSTNPSLLNENCPRLLKYTLDHLSEYETIVFAGAWSGYLHDPEKPSFLADFAASLRFVTKQGKRAVVMAQAPVFNSEKYNRYIRAKYSLVSSPNIEALARELVESATPEVAAANAEIRRVIAGVPGAELQDPISVLERRGAGLPFLDGELVYRDYGHFNESGSRKLAHPRLSE